MLESFTAVAEHGEIRRDDSQQSPEGYYELDI
jgi:hypothetical protein